MYNLVGRGQAIESGTFTTPFYIALELVALRDLSLSLSGLSDLASCLVVVSRVQNSPELRRILDFLDRHRHRDPRIAHTFGRTRRATIAISHHTSRIGSASRSRTLSLDYIIFRALTL